MTTKVAAHLFEEPEPVEKLRPETPPAVVAVVRLLMAKQPDDRFQTAAEVAGVLAALLAQLEEDGRPLPVAAAGVPPSRLLRSRRGNSGNRCFSARRPWSCWRGWREIAALPPFCREASRPLRRPPPPPPPAAGELALECEDASVRVLVHPHAEAGKGGVLRPNVPVPVAAGEYDLELAGDRGWPACACRRPR